MTKPHLVIVDSNTAGIHLLRMAKERGYEVTYIESREGPRYYARDVGESVKALVDRVITVNESANASDLEEALRVLIKQRPVHGLICVWDRCLLAAATAAARVGIPFTDLGAVTLCREKYRAREVLRAQQIPSAEFGTAETTDAALAVAARIGYPVIAKPSSGGGSLLAEVCDDEKQLTGYFAKLSAQRAAISADLGGMINGPILIEEVLVGRMVSAEVVACEGTYGVVAVGLRRRAEVNQTWELGSTYPAPISQKEHDEVCDYAIRVTKALGLQLGLFHLEIMITDKGPRLIEANPRAMGGNGRAVIQAAYDVDIFDVLLDAHMEGRWRPAAKAAQWYSVSLALAAVEGGQGRPVSERDLPRSELGELVKFVFSPPASGLVPKYRSNFEAVGVIITRARQAQQAVQLSETLLDEAERLTGLQFLR